MQSFKRKKEDFDNLVDTAHNNIKRAKKLYKTFKNLETIEKNKSEELINILFFLDEFYEKNKDYYEGIDNLKLAIANDVKSCQKKSEFYKNISKFHTNVKSDLNPLMEYKTRMYNCFEEEYQYLNKRNLLEEKIKYIRSQQTNLSENNPTTKKIENSIKENENRLDKATNDSNKVFSTFIENSKIYNHNKFKSVNPIFKKFIDLKYDHFNKLEDFYREAFKNKNKLDIKNRPANFKSIIGNDHDSRNKNNYDSRNKNDYDNRNNFDSRNNSASRNKNNYDSRNKNDYDNQNNYDSRQKNNYDSRNKNDYDNQNNYDSRQKNNYDSRNKNQNKPNFNNEYEEKKNFSDSYEDNNNRNNNYDNNRTNYNMNNSSKKEEQKKRNYPNVPEYEDNYKNANKEQNKNNFYESRNFQNNKNNGEFLNKNEIKKINGLLDSYQDSEKIKINNLYNSEDRRPPINDFFSKRIEKDPRDIFNELFDIDNGKSKNQITFSNEGNRPFVQQIKNDNYVVPSNNYFNF